MRAAQHLTGRQVIEAAVLYGRKQRAQCQNDKSTKRPALWLFNSIVF